MSGLFRIAAAGIVLGIGLGFPAPELFGTTDGVPAVVFAKGNPAAEESPPANGDEAASETPSLPHGRFIWDYLLVLLLVAGSLYAVCRSSRRV